MKLSAFTTVVLLVASTTAIQQTPEGHISTRDGSASTPDPRSLAIVQAAAPDSNSCASAAYPDECVTASDATIPILDSFAKYQITSPGEQVALLAWMAFESGDFQYVRNHFPAPGTPGQGTRCMMSPEFVAKFAPTLGVQPGSDPANTLDTLLTAPGAEWDAASWFLTTQCSDDIRTGLQTNTFQGFSDFTTKCISTSMTDDRKSGWQAAAKAFGLSGN